MRDATLDGAASWVRLALTLAVASVGSAAMWIAVMVMPAIGAAFEVGRADAAMPYMLTMAGFALGNLVLGRAVDRHGVGAVLLVSSVLVAGGFALAVLAPTMAVLGMCHFVMGFGSSVCFGPLIADISHWFLRRRGVAVAIIASGNYLAGTIWPFSLRGVLEAQGWTAVYLIMAAVTLVVMIPGALALRRPLPDGAHAAAEARVAANQAQGGLSPRFLQAVLVIAGFACCMAMAMPQVHIVALCVELGFGETVGTEMLSLMLLGGVISRLGFGFLADRIGGVATVLIGSGLQCLALFLYLPVVGMTALFAVSLVFGLSQGGIVPSYAVIVRDFLPAREAGARVGLVIFATIIGMATGGWMAGWIFDQTGSYTPAFLNGIGWNLLNIAVMLLLVAAARRGRRRVYG